MQHITTKYLAPTNTRGARIKATTSYGKTSKTMPYEYGATTTGNHLLAAKALASDLGWRGEWFISGEEPSGYIFSRVPCACDFVV